MKKLPMCKYFTTSGYPNFNPECLKRHKASKKCHEERKDCADYECSWSNDRRLTK